MTMMSNVIAFEPRLGQPRLRRPRLLVSAARPGLPRWNRRRHLLAMRPGHLHGRRQATLVGADRLQQGIDRLDGARNGRAQRPVRCRRTPQHALQRGKQTHPDALPKQRVCRGFTMNDEGLQL